MANSYLIETPRGNEGANKLQIATLIESFLRSLELLTADIEHEEVSTGVRDLSDPTYPVLARSLRVRRDNIGATIALLRPSGAKSQRTRYDGTRGGVGII
jgi:hypothetical protein